MSRNVANVGKVRKVGNFLLFVIIKAADLI